MTKTCLIEISEDMAKEIIDCIGVAECECQASDKMHEFADKLRKLFDLEEGWFK